MSYHISPHATTNTPPCELFLKSTIRPRLDLIRPDLGSAITDRQSAQKTYHDIRSRWRDFFLGQRVLAHNFREGPRWVPSMIAEKGGPLNYLVQIREDILWKRHVDQIISAADTPDDVSPHSTVPVPASLPSPLPSPQHSSTTPITPPPSQPVETQEQSVVQESMPATPTAQPQPSTPPWRYPLRQNRRPPKHFEFPIQPSDGRKENCGDWTKQELLYLNNYLLLSLCLCVSCCNPCVSSCSTLLT